MNLLESLRRGWWYVLLVALPVTFGVVLYTQSQANQYTATSVVSFAPRPNAQIGADVVSIVVPKYQVYVTSDSVVAGVAQMLGVQKTQISDHLDASIPTNTSNLEISVDGRSPTFVAKAANELATVTATFSRSDPLLEGTIVARPVVPTTPSGPNRHLLDLAGLVVALLLGAGVALSVDRVRPVVKTAADVVDATQLRVIGVLPRSKAVQRGGLTRRRGDRQTLAHLRNALNDRTVGSAIGNLRNQLDRAGILRSDEQSQNGNVLVVTGSVPGEGKTTIASLLALASARVAREVLLIDGDLVRPSLARLFRVSARIGVVQALRGQDVRLYQHACKEVVPNLRVMPSEPESEAGSLIAQNMEPLLAWASSASDLVIVDTPPVFGNDSGQTLASLADAVLLVVGRGTRETMVSEAAATLRSLDVHILGAVANEIKEMESYAYY